MRARNAWEKRRGVAGNETIISRRIHVFVSSKVGDSID